MSESRPLLPAEWHRQAAVLMTWSHAETDWAPILDHIHEEYRMLSRAIRRYQPVIEAALAFFR